ncbi:lactoferrin/transferrin family TonB-dependent receptor [Pasteurella sp. PK-2025]|uniref:lactoferrin/transferrin family TonB-dependent receptor n=1 Tax=unclassified Pasteurella TaxID=2621516 RepID=UPI003C75A225
MRSKNNKSKPFVYSAIYLAIFVYPVLPYQAWADASATGTQQLSDVYVVGKKKATRKDNEVTGLGKVVKNREVIDKEQVLGIRDLVRYDPGVTVVEQGRGGSAGYAIRGVDKNRVALFVDGIPQAQSYVVQGNNSRARQGGGSINEVENENIASVEISKGASSAEYGSGSLGGAIGFRTKEPADLIKEGKTWGLSTKSAYSSKNKQYTHSIGFAARQNHFEGLVQYTHKKGEETHVHKDAINTTNYRVTRLGVYENIYDFRAEPNKKSAEWFVIKGACGDVQCAPRAYVHVTDSHFRYGDSRTTPFTPEEQAEIAKIPHLKETLSAREYTGDDRVMPDPMDYKTESWLAKLGYHFDDRHYLGTVLEHTTQKYDIRDMGVKAYYSGSEKTRFINSQGVYGPNQSLLDGASINRQIGLRWSRTRFHDEAHSKKRQGIVYRYRGDDNRLFNLADLSYDYQKIVLNTLTHNRHCSEYPTVDKYCRPSLDKPWSYYDSERNKYTEEHHLVKASFDKHVNILTSKHKFNVLLGVDKFKSYLNRSDYFNEFAKFDWLPLGGRGYYDNPYVYELKSASIVHQDLCLIARSTYSCKKRLITGHNKFVALRDNIALNKYVDLSLGGRYDWHHFHSDDAWTASEDYETYSWNLGITLKPTKYLAFSYRASSGFRVPSFQELFGYRIPGLVQGENTSYVSDLDPERALNREIGVALKGDFGHLEVSYFNNRYEGLITVADEIRPGQLLSNYGYHNAQDVDLKGINVVGKIDWNGVYDKLPEGLYSTLAYNRIKPKRIVNNPKLTDIRSYIFDAVQPSRYIVGLGYDDPNDKWGINATLTYSKAKNPNEVQSKRFNYVKNRVETVNAADQTARSWYIVDVIGHVNIKDFLTLRAGIYNLMNYRYVTWEAVRQSSSTSIHRHHDVGNYARYAAPGRNFTLSLEMKF